MNHFENITAEKARLLIEGGSVFLADIRDINSYHAGHIEGAQHLSHENLTEFILDADFNKPLIIYCHHGHASQSAADFLVKQGFEEVYSLIGGYNAWAS